MKHSRSITRALATTIASIGLVLAGIGVASAAPQHGSTGTSTPSNPTHSTMTSQKRDSGW